ncbi:helix-turn-helix domain-containing protein [Rhodococcus sp. HS-D2]|uniref:helix-turn-helix domain-containing protein n=1 Tax=Rhodococcus sp. HS-D2 TaxID=1384636 RepID=UPI0007DA101A|nr:helix-turn-helix domain-containing protein [Rhodococcus sp. HS-D2]
MTLPRVAMPSRNTVAVTLAAAAATAVAGTSFWRSFTAIAELAVAYKVPADQAWMIPVAVDGLVVVATVAAAIARRRVARSYSWFLLVAGTVASVAGNGIHAWQLTHSPIGVGIAVLPPLVTLAAVHLTILLARQGDEIATAPVLDIEPEPIRTPLDEGPKRDATPRPVTQLHVAPTTPVASVATPAAAPRQVRRVTTRKSDATDVELRARAIRCVVGEGKTIRATGAELGVSKDKVQRWVTAHRATLDAPPVAS